MEVRTCSFYKTFTFSLQTLLFLFIFSSNVPNSPCFTVASSKEGCFTWLESTEILKRPFNHIGLVPKVLYNAHEIIDCLDWQRETTNRRKYVTIFFISFPISLWFLTLLRKKAPQRGTVSNVQYALSLLSRHSEYCASCTE